MKRYPKKVLVQYVKDNPARPGPPSEPHQFSAPEIQAGFSRVCLYEEPKYGCVCTLPAGHKGEHHYEGAEL